MRVILASILGLAVAGSGCSAEECNGISCEDELVVEFHPASGTFQAGQYQFEVVANGAPMTCTVTIAGDLPSGTCSPASIALVGSLRCEGEACSATPVQTHQVYQMVIRGNPTPIAVTARRDGSVLVQKTANPSYAVCGCEPNGHFGSTSLTVD